MNELIFGKNNKERIVSIEISDSVAELFIEENGQVRSEFVKNKFWILSNEALNKNFIKLKGDLHFKYGVQFDNFWDWKKTKGRYFHNADIFSIYNKQEAFQVKDGYTYYKGIKDPKEISILSFDLETTTLDPHQPEAKILLISTTFRKPGVLKRRLFSYDEYSNTEDFLKAFADYICEVNPSIITGHNILSFDFSYIKGICDKENIQLVMGRNGSYLNFEEGQGKFRKEGGNYINFPRIRIYGREIVDTLFLSIKHDIATRKYTSFGLKNIIKQEGLEKEGRQFYDASQIRHKYKDPIEWKKIKQYCEEDSDDSLKLFDLMVPPFFFLTQSVPKCFQQMIESASGSQLNSMLIRSYLQKGHSIPKGDNKVPFQGAISMGEPGIYRNVWKIDVASLYPSIMLSYKVYDKEKDPEGNFLKILEIFTEERLKNKKLYKDTREEYYDSLQGAQKIVINSLYGFLGAQRLNFNSPHLASFVTEKGREILKRSILWATGKEYTLQLEEIEDEEQYS